MKNKKLYNTRICHTLFVAKFVANSLWTSGASGNILKAPSLSLMKIQGQALTIRTRAS